MRIVCYYMSLLLLTMTVPGCKPPGVIIPPPPPPPPISGRWSITCGGTGVESPSCIRQTSDGGYVVSGSTTSYWVGLTDAWILKLADDGTVEWQRSYGSVYNDEFQDILQTDDGGYIVAGSSERRTTYTYDDTWILKLAPDGTIEWQKKYCLPAYSCRIEDIRPTPDGGYILCGNTGYFSGWKVIILKLTEDGTIEWQKTYEPGSGDGHSYSIEPTADGGFILSGYVYRPFSSGFDAWLLKLTSSGGREWDAAYGSEGDDRFYSVLEKVGGGYVAVGRYGSGGGWILNLTDDGSVIWQKRYGDHSSDDFIRIIVEDDGYAVGGNRYRPYGTDLWMMKVSPDGDILQQAAYGSSSTETAYGFDHAKDSGFVISGTIDSSHTGIPNHGSETWIVNVPTDGQLPGAAFMVNETVTAEDTTVTRETIVGPFWIRDVSTTVSDSSVLALHTGGIVQILYP